MKGSNMPFGRMTLRYSYAIVVNCCTSRIVCDVKICKNKRWTLNRIVDFCQLEYENIFNSSKAM